MQVKLFSNTNVKNLETEINEWLNGNVHEIIDIKFNSATETNYWEGNAGVVPSQDETFYTAMIIYK